MNLYLKHNQTQMHWHMRTFNFLQKSIMEASLRLDYLRLLDNTLWLHFEYEFSFISKHVWREETNTLSCHEDNSYNGAFAKHDTFTQYRNMQGSIWLFKHLLKSETRS